MSWSLRILVGGIRLSETTYGRVILGCNRSILGVRIAAYWSDIEHLILFKFDAYTWTCIQKPTLQLITL